MASLRFALNHIAAPQRPFAAFAQLARGLGLTDVEIRNDLRGVALQDGTPAATIRAEAAAAGVTILTINALQRFEDWSTQRAEEAIALADYARDCGARALVLCPTNDHADARTPAQRADGLRNALSALRPILSSRGLTGLIEPLGFAECALRLKGTAIAAMDETGTAVAFAVLHDTFHHFLAGEQDIFPMRTGLVHISGVEDASLPHGDIRDGHRVLVGHRDIMDNAGQIRGLLAGGYAGPFSFEPFSPEVHTLPDLAAALRDSMGYLRAEIA